VVSMSIAYYNENDPEAAAWLCELIKKGHIAPGVVDTRSIEDVRPSELVGFTQCHFFAGIGGWSLALRMAGWPDDKPVWTGSCPCQPFSAAGKGGGFDDERHLWPHLQWLIENCRPVTVFGEQVASKDGLAWFDLVQSDLEAADYTSAGVDLCAAGFGAQHIRQRLFWVANTEGAGQLRALKSKDNRSGMLWKGTDDIITMCAGESERLANTSGNTGDERTQLESDRREVNPNPTNGYWANADWLGCRDGKWRPVEPGTFPLDYGLSARVVRLRGYGNAIVPQVAAAFIEATL
jgi:DNA (cytosine-5)-methyltransferase 1